MRNERRGKCSDIYLQDILLQGILSHLIIDILNQLYQIYYQFLANGNFILTHSVIFGHPSAFEVG